MYHSYARCRYNTESLCFVYVSTSFEMSQDLSLLLQPYDPSITRRGYISTSYGPARGSLGPGPGVNGGSGRGRGSGRPPGESLAKSSLVIHEVNVRDSGNYTCQCIGASSKDSVNVHVLVEGIILLIREVIVIDSTGSVYSLINFRPCLSMAFTSFHMINKYVTDLHCNIRVFCEVFTASSSTVCFRMKCDFDRAELRIKLKTFS